MASNPDSDFLTLTLTLILTLSNNLNIHHIHCSFNSDGYIASYDISFCHGMVAHNKDDKRLYMNNKYDLKKKLNILLYTSLFFTFFQFILKTKPVSQYLAFGTLCSSLPQKP